MQKTKSWVVAKNNIIGCDGKLIDGKKNYYQVNLCWD